MTVLDQLVRAVWWCDEDAEPLAQQMITTLPAGADRRRATLLTLYLHARQRRHELAAIGLYDLLDQDLAGVVAEDAQQLLAACLMELGRDDAAQHLACRPLSPRPASQPGSNYWVASFEFNSIAMPGSGISIHRDIIGPAGLELDPADEDELAQALYATLQERVGKRLVLQINAEQFDELCALQESPDDQAQQRCADWLRLTIPDFPFVVRAETSRLRRELVARLAPSRQ